MADTALLKRPTQEKPVPQLPYIKGPEGEKPVSITRVEVETTITGLFAETTQILHVYNPNSRDLEGKLVFPLPDSGKVCGYGLDVQGVLVDGVIVPKKKARQVLEAEVRKQIDPGLVEQVAGNVYQTRIYPIPAQGSRIVSITYSSELDIREDTALFHLPLGHLQAATQASLRIRLQKVPGEPEITGGLGCMSLQRAGQNWVAEAELISGQPLKDMLLRIVNLSQEIILVERCEDNTFFYCSHAYTNRQCNTPWKPERLGIAWDASGSRENIETDLALLEELVFRLNGCIVDLAVFRNRMEDIALSWEIDSQDITSLITYLRNIAYDGATQLAELDFSHLPAGAPLDGWLLFSDGLDTVPGQLPKLGAIPVFPVITASRRNRDLLDYLAEQSGGKVIDVCRQYVASACLELVTDAQQPRLVETRGCKDVRVRSHGGRLHVSGVLTSQDGSVRVAASDAQSMAFTVRASDAVPGKHLARMWAGSKVQLLTLTGQEHAQETMELCRTYNIVSPCASLLVLESLEQYLEYGITPPENLPDIRVDYFIERHLLQEKEVEDKEEHLKDLLKLWKKRITWWKRDFHAEMKQRARKQKNKAAAENSPSADEPAFDNRQEHGIPRLYNSTTSEAFRTSELLGDFSEEGQAHYSFSTGDEDAFPQPPTRLANAAIGIQPWNPETPYLEKIRLVASEDQYSQYLQQRDAFKQSPSFYLDCADYFFSCNKYEVGRRVLSNLLEMQSEDPALMRVYSWRLQQVGLLDEAIVVLEKVLAIRDDEPQSYRDLALALAQRWEKSGQQDDVVRSMELLYQVIEKRWKRFPEIEIIALMELNRILHPAESHNIAIPEQIDPRFRTLLDLDVRISMSWDADNTDIDLHVFEPDGSHAYYASNLTEQGGLVSRDVTDGYGPEEYVLQKALPGTYTIKAHYYGSHQQTLLGPCTVKVDVFTNYARSNEERQTLTLRLDKSGEDFVVGEVVVAG